MKRLRITGPCITREERIMWAEHEVDRTRMLLQNDPNDAALRLAYEARCRELQRLREATR